MLLLLMSFLFNLAVQADDPTELNWATGGCSEEICVRLSETIYKNFQGEGLQRKINGHSVVTGGGHREDPIQRNSQYLLPILKVFTKECKNQKAVQKLSSQSWVSQLGQALHGLPNTNDISQAANNVENGNGEFFKIKCSSIWLYGFYFWANSVSSFDYFRITNVSNHLAPQ